MAVVSRVATLRLDDDATHQLLRQWVATAVTQDTAAGSSVDITVVQTSDVGGPGQAGTLVLNLYKDDGALIRQFSLDPAAASQTVSFFFTDTGASGGSARSGTVEIAIRATRAVASTYDVETDGNPNDPPALNHSHTLDRGWIRGTTTAVQDLSNVGLGNGAVEPAQYDESLFVRTTLGVSLYVARALTVAVSGATPALSGSTVSGTGPTFDKTFAAAVDNRFPAAVSNVATSVSVPNAALTGVADTVLTVTPDTLSVDPRVTSSHLLQNNDNVFGSPPLSKNESTGTRQTTQIAFLSTHLRGSRGTAVGNVRTEGKSGVTVHTVLQDADGFSDPVTQDAVTALQGGEEGWTPFLQWLSQLPTGAWTKTVSITAPADLVGSGYVLNATITYQLTAPGEIAAGPALDPIPYAQHGIISYK